MTDMTENQKLLVAIQKHTKNVPAWMYEGGIKPALFVPNKRKKNA